MSSDPTSVVPAGIRRGSTYFPELESLRGLAIALVFVFHADGSLLFPVSNRVGLRRRPAAAVRVGRPHRRHAVLRAERVPALAAVPRRSLRRASGVAGRQFYEPRRALRILPGLLGGGGGRDDPHLAHARRSPARVSLSWPFFSPKPTLPTPMRPYSGVWWSLATEVQFYVLLPLIALAFGRSRWVTLALLAGYAATYLAVATGLVLPGIEPWLRAQSVVGRGPLFLCGILAAWFYRRHGDALRARLAASRPLAAGGADMILAVVFVALALLLRWVNRSGFFPIEQTRWYVWHVPEGVLWTAVVLIVLPAPLRLKAVLSNRGLAWLGVLSYSIYLRTSRCSHDSVGVGRRLFPGMTGGARARCSGSRW